MNEPTIQLKRFFIVESYPFWLIGCKGHNMPLPFNYLSQNAAFADAYRLDTGIKTVASLYFTYYVAGNNPIGSKPRKYSEWLEKNEKNFEHWYK